MGASALSSNFAQHCKTFSNSCEVRRFMRDSIEISVLWKGDTIKTLKNVGTPSCQLCMKKRHNILKEWRRNKKQLMNSRTEIF